MLEKTVAVQTAFQGRLLTVECVTVELESGVRATRDIVRHRGAVAVLARQAAGRFVLVKQFRKPLERETIEIIAGCREAGETPEQTAVREVREETGYEVASLRPLGSLYPAPGYCTERLELYFAELQAQRGRPAPDDDERLTVLCLTRAEVEAEIAAGRIEDAKTLVAWCRFAHAAGRVPPTGAAGAALSRDEIDPL